jgi:tetratricopeptide (TPR) repeat protein
VAPAVTIGLTAGIALWGVHAGAAIGLRRVESLLDDRPRLPEATRAQAYDFLGVRALNAGEAAVAAAYFERSIECGPNPRLFHQLGLARLANGETDRARVAFQQAARLNPTVVDPWIGLTRVALAQRDTVNAIAYLDSSLARYPEHAEARRVRNALSRARE